MFRACSALGALVALTMSQAFSAEPGQLITSAAYWRTFQWEGATVSKFWAASGWVDYDETIPDEKAVWLKQRDATVFGHAGRALLSRLKANEPYTDRAHFLFDSNLAGCREFFDEASELFGKPIESDGSWTTAFSPDNYVKAIFLSYQWDLGPTRISGGCIGSAGTEDDRRHTEKITGSLLFTHNSVQEKLLPDVILRCSRTLRLTDGRDGGKYGDVVVRINQSSKLVTNAAGGRLDSSGLEATNSYFAFVTRDEDKDVTTSWRIDRLDGTLRVDISVLDEPTGSVTGTCDKLERIEAKF